MVLEILEFENLGYEDLVFEKLEFENFRIWTFGTQNLEFEIRIWIWGSLKHVMWKFRIGGFRFENWNRTWTIFWNMFVVNIVLFRGFGLWFWVYSFWV